MYKSKLLILSLVDPFVHLFQKWKELQGLPQGCILFRVYCSVDFESLPMPDLKKASKNRNGNPFPFFGPSSPFSPSSLFPRPFLLFFPLLPGGGYGNTLYNPVLMSRLCAANEVRRTVSAYSKLLASFYRDTIMTSTERFLHSGESCMNRGKVHSKSELWVWQRHSGS